MLRRDCILDDNEFWMSLEFHLSGELHQMSDMKLKHFWIDGFIPRSSKNTKYGIDVIGSVWVVDGQDQQSWSFVLHVPQKMLFKRIEEFIYSLDLFGVEEKKLEITLESKAGAN